MIKSLMSFYVIFLFALMPTKSFAADDSSVVGTKKLVIITDLEPDDRIALQLLAEKVNPNDVAFVGTTLLNSKRKTALTRRLLDQIGFQSVRVAQGYATSPEEHVHFASSAAALEYQNEGQGLITNDDINKIIYGEDNLEAKLADYLIANYRAGNRRNIDIVLLAPPTDLLGALLQAAQARGSVGAIHMMGGWVDVQNKNGQIEKRSTYNWNMAFKSSSSLFVYMKSWNIDIYLYSSHLIKSAFGGGSINKGNYPDVIEAFEKSSNTSPSLADFKVAGSSWDRHLINKIPALANVIGPYAGEQFTPADPLVMLGAIDSRLILNTKKVDIDIETSDVYSPKGFLVNVTENPKSRVNLVEQVDVNLFKSVMIQTFLNAPSRPSNPPPKGILENTMSCTKLFD